MKVGLRVVRGRDWKWSNQDGGEGCVGTIVVVGRPGSQSSPDKTAIVQWDVGGKTNYRCGHENAYDLYFLDNGPIGVLHSDVSCSCCHEQAIKGMLWQCASCHGYSLCSACYHGDEHSLAHQFYRIDTPTSIPILLRPREGSLKIQSGGTFAQAIVTRGPDWDWGNQDGGPTQKGLVTAVKGWDNETFRSVVSVTWANNESNVYRCGHKGKVDVISLSPAEGVCYYKDHLPRVCSSLPEPPSPTQLTSPLSPLVRSPTTSPSRSQFPFPTVHVPWQQHQQPFIQHQHPTALLPQQQHQHPTVLLPQQQHQHPTAFLPQQQHQHFTTFLPQHQYPTALVQQQQQQFVRGEKVRILLDVDVLKYLQSDYGWTDKFKWVIGKVGTVHSVSVGRNNGILVMFPVGRSVIKLVVNPAALSKVVELQVNDRVRVLSDTSLVEKLQEGHGEWDDSMIQMLGKEGVVQKVYTDGDVKVLVGNTSWTLNPAILFTTSGIHNTAEQQQHQQQDASSSLSPAGSASLSSEEVTSTEISDSDLTSQLVSAAGQGQYSRVKDILTAHPGTVNGTHHGKTALHVSSGQGHVDVVNLLLNSGANDNIQDDNGDTALHLAASENKTQVAAALIQHGANVNIVNNRNDTALSVSVNKGHGDMVQILIDGGCNINTQDSLGNTALHDAISSDQQQDIAIRLVNSDRCDLSIVNHQGFNAFHRAALKGRQQAVTAMLSKRPDLLNSAKDDGFTALHLSSLNGHVGLVTDLVSKAGCEINIVNDKNQTALLLAVDKGHEDVVKVLLEHNANPNIQDDVGDTPLHTAAANHYFHDNTDADASVIRLLVQYGADTNLVNQDNKTAIDLCNGNEMASWLTRAAASSAQGTSLPSPIISSPPHDIKTSSVLMATSNKCRLCDNPVDCEFIPCGHRAVCFDCGGMFKACIQCKNAAESVRKLEITEESEGSVVVIPCQRQAVSSGGAVSNLDQEKYGQNLDSLADLQAKLQEMEEAQTCLICMENKRDIVFLCGHSTCHVCCESLRDCPMCRRPIEKKITLYS